MPPEKISAAGSDPDTSSVGRFLRSANLCRTRDLEQLVILSELVRALSELVHALQKERGASSIFLGSTGTQFAERLGARVADCQVLEQTIRDQLEHVDDRLDRMSSGARFYTRVALALRALDTLPALRNEIVALRTAPQDSVKAFTDIIGALLAMGYEIGEIAADPEISRAVVALVNFAQAKEYAGQERATAGACLSSGQLHGTDQQRLQYLIAAQEQAFGIFGEFASQPFIDSLNEALNSRDSAAVHRMRSIMKSCAPGEPTGTSADAWYQHATRRIDGLRVVEEQMSDELGRLCAIKLREAHSAATATEAARNASFIGAAPIAVLFAGADPGHNDLGDGAGTGLYGLNPVTPKPMRSILNVVEAQSRLINDVSAQLESARAALTERKLVDRAKGLLMDSRGISEKAAYAVMRETAMRQNKRIAQIAEALISAAEILKG